MATEAPGVSMLTFVSDDDLSADENIYLAVSLQPGVNVTGNGQGGGCITPYKAGGNNAIGILQNTPLQGEGGTVMMDGLSRCQAAGTWTVGDKLSVADGGKLQKAGSSDSIFGYAKESAVAGDISSVLFSALSRP